MHKVSSIGQHNWLLSTICYLLLSSALMLYFLSPSVSFASEKQISLSDAVKTALENNHEILAFKNSLYAQKEDIGIARSFLLPKITFQERYMRTNNPTYSFMAKLNQERFAQSDFEITSLNNPKSINDFQTSLSFEQPVFMRKANIGIDISKREFSAKAEEFIRKKEDIAFRVVQTYLMVQTAKEHVKVAELALEDAKEHLRIAEQRYKTGLGLYSDTLRASTSVTDAEQKLTSAKKNLNVAKRALGVLLGMSESIDSTDEKVDFLVMDIDYYTNAALSRKDIKSLEMHHENAKNSIKIAESGYLPYIGIGGSYQLNDHKKPFGSEGDSWQITAFLRWELFDGTKREYERSKAKYKALETEEYLNNIKKAVAFKVYEAYLGVEEARKNLELSKAALKTAEEGKRLVEIRYKNALSPIVDLMDAQVSLDHARANLVAKENEYRLAVVNLSYESGTILKDLRIEQ
ncbi:TolC family protein [hot springs metagenome]|uniref:TolC family protein n=1 Tax=hot springs metagenome TaxID=433727 RepID=A0A5J4L5D7_9ZZZZ